MHTFNGKATYIHHNGDLSGEIIIIDKKTGNKIEVPSQDILDFAAEHIRMEKISALEQAEPAELLEVGPWAWQGLLRGDLAK